VDHWMLGRVTLRDDGYWKFNNCHEFKNLNLYSDWDAHMVGEATYKYTTNKEIKTLGRKGIMIGVIPN
jgi:hypothetical protein